MILAKNICWLTVLLNAVDSLFLFFSVQRSRRTASASALDIDLLELTIHDRHYRIGRIVAFLKPCELKLA